MPPSATKTCPTCQKLWAATFKFCPEDGSGLVEQAQAVPRSDMPAPRPKGRSSRLLDVPPVIAEPQEKREPPPRDASRRQGRSNVRAEPPPTERVTRVVKGGAAAARTTSRQEASTSPERPAYNLRTAPTLLLTPAISEEVAQAALARAEQKATSSRGKDDKTTKLRDEDKQATQMLPRAEPQPSKAEGKRKKGGFSETEWFLAPIDPNDVDAKTGQVLVDPAKYERNTAIPDEKRRRFSLRRDDEE